MFDMEINLTLTTWIRNVKRIVGWGICCFIYCLCTLNIGFAEESLQGTEWKTDCHKAGSYYFVLTRAFFEGDEFIHSWKWYIDPSCEKNLKGEFWDKWKTVSIKPSSMGPDIFETKSLLLDGYKSQCKTALGLFSKKDDKLYFGEVYGGTKKQLGCEELPTELKKIPYISSSSITQSAEEYTKTLRRVFKK